MFFATFCTHNMLAQNYQIRFSGTGETTSVTSVLIENLTQGTALEIDGSEILHLVATITATESVPAGMDKQLVLSPNPMEDYSRMKFSQHESGVATITIHDLAGKRIAGRTEYLEAGDHTFRIEGIAKGTYLVSVSSGRYKTSGKLISLSSTNGAEKIILEQMGFKPDSEKVFDSKGSDVLVPMQYNSGDKLKVTGTGNTTSGMVATVGIMIPTSDVIYTFNFISCEDGDKNRYPIVKIGQQIWMAENLKTTKYSDKTAIVNAEENAAWLGLTEGGYCWYNNDPVNRTKFGGLYNWQAVVTGKLCPSGWRVPTVDDWQTLTANTGGNSYPGGNLKETGYLYWYSPNEGATNQTGFGARGGGYRDSTPGAGIFHKLMVDGYWWTSTEYDAATAKCIYIYYYNAIIWDNTTGDKGDGTSVRCIKN